MHSGNVGHAQDLDSLVRAATFLRDLDDLRIMIIGMGARHAELVALAELLEVDQVQFLYYQSRDVLPQSLSAADVHVVGLAAGPRGLRRPEPALRDPRRRQAGDRRRGRGERDRAARRPRSAAASSCRRAVPSCLRARSAMRTTGSTTSRRWARADASGSSAKPTVPSPSAATATSCSSLRRSYARGAGLIAALALVAGWNAYKYPSGGGLRRAPASRVRGPADPPRRDSRARDAERVLHAAGLLRARRRGDATSASTCTPAIRTSSGRS